MSGKAKIFIALAAFTTYFLVVLIRGLVFYRTKNRSSPAIQPSRPQLATGFITNFFDTLGIGSFATTTTIFKLGRMVPDERIPGTMNVGHTLPTILQAFIYIAVVHVDLFTLMGLISAAVFGAWAGARIVAGLPRRKVQLGVGMALVVSLLFMLMGQLGLFPIGGEELGLTGWKLGIGMTVNFLIAAVSTLGIGFYAPCMILVSLLGMNPLAAFPVMMGSAAFLMPVASTRFIGSEAYRPQVAVGLALGGLPAVLLAAFIVKSLPLYALRWLVMVVVLLAAIMLLRSAFASSETSPVSIPAEELT